MEREIHDINLEQPAPLDAPEPLPFPFNHQTFCRYESIEKKLERARVLIVDNLLRNEGDLSDVARADWGKNVSVHLRRERQIAELALQNIASNVRRLVKEPRKHVTHVTTVPEATKTFQPDAIVLSGTLRDFDYYQPNILSGFTEFIRQTTTPVLGICGGHQLIGLSFGAQVLTLGRLEQHEQRINRPQEYQYRLVRIVSPSDPIFAGIDDPQSGVWQDYTKKARILRVWQNHGLQLDSVPEGFQLLATSYLCKNQMMVKRSDGQMIYTVQFHLEKSFEDWHKNPTRWEHPNESRDGRILFENFLRLALENREQ